MVTKLLAAQLATAKGVNLVISNGQRPELIPDIIDDILCTGTRNANFLYTHFVPKQVPMLDRKWWIMHGLATRGLIVIDTGAYEAISSTSNRASLFASGIVSVQGVFSDQQAVVIAIVRDGIQIKIGKGLTNYTSDEINRVKGCKSSELAAILGYEDAECIIHRENLIILSNNS